MSKLQKYNNNVPTLTNLVAAGNPRKKTTLTKRNTASPHLNDLNQRINEIESAIGQNKTGPIGRAFAIRAETNKSTKPSLEFKPITDLQKNKIIS